MASIAKSPLSPTNYKTLLKGRQSADPFAPMTPGQINQTVGKYTAGYGTPQTDAQIQSSAQGMLDPIIAAVTKNINDKAAASGRAITGNASSLANSLGGIDWNAPYASAETGQAAVDAALQQSLNGEGASGAADLASRLGSINDPTVANAASALGSRGTAIGTTQLASGSANLGSLLAQAAGARSYGQKLPGLARLSGLQDVANTNQTALNDIGDASTSLLGQLPGIVQNLRNSAQSLRGDKASAAAQLYETLTGQNITKATAKAGLENTSFDNGLAYANTFGTDPVTGQPVKGYHLGPNGNAVKNAPPPKPPSASGTKALNDLAHTLYNGVAPHYHPINVKDPKTGAITVDWKPVPGTGEAPTKWNDAVRRLIAGGAKDRAAAVALLAAQGWQHGEGGRPMSADQKRIAAGPAQGGRIGGKPMTPAQIASEYQRHKHGKR